MKYLTKKQAIKLCIELWTWLAETGLRKDQWPRWPELVALYGEIWGDCWFCEYDSQMSKKYKYTKKKSCKYCPLLVIHGGCEYSSYPDWVDAQNVEEKKVCAAEFLLQIKKAAIKCQVNTNTHGRQC